MSQLTNLSGRRRNVLIEEEEDISLQGKGGSCDIISR
jgi:hypothetical protein